MYLLKVKMVYFYVRRFYFNLITAVTFGDRA